MRLVVDPTLEDEAAVTAYRATLAWAAERADRFVLLFERSRGHDPAVLAALEAIGRRVRPTLVRPPGLIASLFFGAYRVEQREGRPDRALVDALTAHAPPEEAPGDLCPASMLGLYLGARRLYWCGDFGRDQVLDVEAGERDDLARALTAAGLTQECLRPSPR